MSEKDIEVYKECIESKRIIESREIELNKLI